MRKEYRTINYKGVELEVSNTGDIYFKGEEVPQYKNKKTGYMGIPCGISYTGEVFRSEMFTELGTGTFCGYEVTIPKDYDGFLSHVYGDYMKMPPEEEREIHTVKISSHGL